MEGVPGQEYQKEAHGGIKEYYESYGVGVPACGITPGQEWLRDGRGLVFPDVSAVAEASRHREKRRTDGAGCFSFRGGKYEAGTAFADLGVETAYGPMDTDTVTVYCRGAEPVSARRMETGAYAAEKPEAPLGMAKALPESPRPLDALGKKYKEVHGQMAAALSFSDYVKEASDNVWEIFWDGEHSIYGGHPSRPAVYVPPYRRRPGKACVRSGPADVCGGGGRPRLRQTGTGADVRGRLGREKYQLLYLPDSKLTPEWLYAGLLDQLGLEAHFYSGVSKRMPQKGIGTVCTVQKKKVACVLDEAHLLGKGMLEGLGFLLDYKFGSESPMSLVLVGQT